MEVPTAADLSKQREKSNNYATNKSFSQGLLSTSVFQQQISILIWVWTNSIQQDGLEIALTVITIMAMCNQFLIYTLLSILIPSKGDKTYFKRFKIEYLNTLVTYLSGISLIFSIAITSLYQTLLSQVN